MQLEHMPKQPSRRDSSTAASDGLFETSMTQGMTEAALEQVKAQTPMGRLGKPEEIADAVAFLASPRSGFITGQVLGVNGGMYM
jgi:NAD(P)-dependent dehydrogenase (short-subunit alcohol dehydrogenase family)